MKPPTTKRHGKQCVCEMKAALKKESMNTKLSTAKLTEGARKSKIHTDFSA